MILKVDTENYAGKRLRKAIAIKTNDPQRSQINLTIEGKVVRFVTIDPKIIILKGDIGKELLNSIRIFPEKKYPFNIVQVHTEKKQNFRYRLSLLNKDGQKGYLLTVWNIKKDPGRYVDAIYLETDNDIGPIIRIPVFGNITQ
ncbi:MAG: hypothetical protein R6T98_08875 [Desulfatiglandales bacterium]